MITNPFNFTIGQTVYYRHPVTGYRVCKYRIISDFDSKAEVLEDIDTGKFYFIKNVCEYDIRTEREYILDHFAPMMGIDTETAEAYCDSKGIN